MKGTCYGNNLDIDDCSITAQSCPDMFGGSSRVGSVGWHECLSLIDGDDEG